MRSPIDVFNVPMPFLDLLKGMKNSITNTPMLGSCSHLLSRHHRLMPTSFSLRRGLLTVSTLLPSGEPSPPKGSASIPLT